MKSQDCFALARQSKARQAKLNVQHGTHTHAPKTLVIACTRNQLDIGKEAEHRQDQQEQRESTRGKLEAQAEAQKQLPQGGGRKARAPSGSCRR